MASSLRSAFSGSRTLSPAAAPRPAHNCSLCRSTRSLRRAQSSVMSSSVRATRPVPARSSTDVCGSAHCSGTHSAPSNGLIPYSFKGPFAVSDYSRRSGPITTPTLRTGAVQDLALKLAEGFILGCKHRLVQISTAAELMVEMKRFATKRLNCGRFLARRFLLTPVC